MTNDDKIKDVELMINYFEEREQYEDCAFLMRIRQRIETRKLLLKIQKDE